MHSLGVTSQKEELKSFIVDNSFFFLTSSRSSQDGQQHPNRYACRFTAYFFLRGKCGDVQGLLSVCTGKKIRIVQRTVSQRNEWEAGEAVVFGAKNTPPPAAAAALS